MRGLRVIVIGVVVLLLAAPVPASAREEPVLRALSFNVHAGIGTDGVLDLERTAAVIRDSGADVVGLQEVDVHWSDRSGYADQATELGRLTGRHVFFAPIYDLDPEPGHTERRRYGVAILSRHPIVAAVNHPLTRLSTVEPDPVAEPMPGFAEAVVSVRGRPVHVYATHLDHRPDPAVRATQVRETVDLLDGDPPGARQVLLGDLNAEPGAPELAPLFASARDAWASAGAGAGHTFPAHAPDSRIDYVTFAGPLAARAVSVPATEASDHRPVLAELTPRRPGR
ncbi:endonuclease/exonuclease/phosphatase family protein [Prauserella cavernicola]|uniref:Endonuclease/exonuclease/phosphatase family protein n=1 Tax=Prauserella cavernicola TaxID=2800127 RepID=A0A934R0B7_9PSEU|nr:endonuclease/exonuclease/phosphatase family protein [Prauserella cavernicola]MBK1788779.1 endonuclease/exonuclease/phosphatase family protein [Prauserella cavernicola]